MIEISEKEIEAAREAWREYWCEEDVPRNTKDGMTAALSAAARVRAEDNAGEPVARDVCPDCGREKAMSAADAAKGLCPKWWAITDADAEKDCRNHVPQPSRPTRELIEAGLLREDEPCECGECTVEECNDCMMPASDTEPSGPVARAGEPRWGAFWYGSPPNKGANIWTLDKYGYRSDLILHVGPDEEHLDLARAICSLHNQRAPQPSGPVKALADALRGLLKAYENAFDWTAELPPETAEAERIANEVLEALTSPTPPTAGGGE